MSAYFRGQKPYRVQQWTTVVLQTGGELDERSAVGKNWKRSGFVLCWTVPPSRYACTL
jgi:hypothetical protein